MRKKDLAAEEARKTAAALDGTPHPRLKDTWLKVRSHGTKVLVTLTKKPPTI